MGTNVYFPTFLKRERKNRNLSQAEMAELIDIPLNTYKSYEGGRREPALSVAMNAVEKLNLCLNEIYDNQDNHGVAPLEQGSIRIVDALPLLNENLSRIDPEAFELLAQIQDEHQLTHIRAFLNQLIIQSKQESKKKSS